MAQSCRRPKIFTPHFARLQDLANQRSLDIRERAAMILRENTLSRLDFPDLGCGFADVRRAIARDDDW
jgi:hypothetical protein